MTELQELRRYRRDLHRIPELDFDLPQTIAYIEGVLAPLACEVIHPCPSCVCAFFDAGTGASHATAIRADMDALPIAETTGAASGGCKSVATGAAVLLALGAMAAVLPMRRKHR